MNRIFIYLPSISLLVFLSGIAVSRTVVLANQPQEHTPAFLCTSPDDPDYFVYIWGGQQNATYRQLGWPCKPTSDIP